jgi:hypothetical protein
MWRSTYDSMFANLNSAVAVRFDSSDPWVSYEWARAYNGSAYPDEQYASSKAPAHYPWHACSSSGVC